MTAEPGTGTTTSAEDPSAEDEDADDMPIPVRPMVVPVN